MVLQIVTADLVGSGAQVNVTTDKDVFIAAGVTVANTDTSNGFEDSAIVGSSSEDTVRLDGTVVASGHAIILGYNPASDSDHRVIIGESGHVLSFAYYGIAFYGHDSHVENHGLIEGDGGIQFFGNASDDPSTLLNEGIIRAVTNAIDGNGGEEYRIENSGFIKGGDYSFYSDSSGKAIITNTGRMVGAIQFASTADSYDGSAGTVKGQVYGGLGDDTLIGGAEKNRFQGDGGRDIISGGAGADMFIYVDAGDSTLDSTGRDIIGDFSHKSRDIVDLSSLIAGELDFVGKSQFSGENEIRYKISGQSTFVYVNLDSDATAEMAIQFAGKIKFVDGDFAV